MLLSEKARTIMPYTAGEQPQDKKYIKLNTNENPYAPSPKAAAAIKNFNAAELRLYPDPQSKRLKHAIAEYEGVAPENIFCGNGSDEVLSLAFLALLSGREQKVFFPDVSYSFYPVFCALYNIGYTAVPLNEDYKVCVSDYLAANNAGGIVLSNPNAPTSLSLNGQEIEEIVQTNPNIPVIVDEAYIDFAVSAVSAVKLTQKYNNLLVVKTFSKSYALAGIRCGYAVGSAELIDGLNRIKDSFNSYPIDRLCETVCMASMADRDYFKQKIRAVICTREMSIVELNQIGFKTPNSETNFLFTSVKGGNAEQAYCYLKNSGILVRYFSKPRLSDKLRITVGTKSEMAELIHVLKNYCPRP